MSQISDACRTAVATAILWPFLAATGVAADLPELETIRTAYIESTAAIQTIQYDLEVHWEPTKDFLAIRKPPGSDLMILAQAHVVQDGARVARQTEYVSESKAVRRRSWAGYDGTLYSSWQHSIQAPPGREQLPDGRIGTEAPPDLRPFSLQTLLGTWLVPDQSIERLLNRPETQVVGWEDVDGARCVKVEMPPYAPLRTKPEFRLQVIGWFDPSHGYLPRRLRTTNPVPAKGAKPMMDKEISVSKFQKLKADATHRWWVPVAGFQNNELFLNRIRLSEIEINPRISDDLFRPEFPFGTQVLEQLPGKLAVQYYAGGDDGAKHYRELMKAQVAAREKEKSEAEAGLTASPDEE